MVFQSYALYPHMTVRGNIEFPLRMRGVGRAERGRQAEAVAALLELQDLLGAPSGRAVWRAAATRRAGARARAAAGALPARRAAVESGCAFAAGRAAVRSAACNAGCV